MGKFPSCHLHFLYYKSEYTDQPPTINYNVYTLFIHR